VRKGKINPTRAQRSGAQALGTQLAWNRSARRRRSSIPAVRSPPAWAA